MSQAPQQRARRRRQRAAAAENANLWATPEHDDDDDDATPELEAPPEAEAAAPATVRSPSLSPCCKVEKKKVKSRGACFPISCPTCDADWRVVCRKTLGKIIDVIHGRIAFLIFTSKSHIFVQ